MDWSSWRLTVVAPVYDPAPSRATLAFSQSVRLPGSPVPPAGNPQPGSKTMNTMPDQLKDVPVELLALSVSPPVVARGILHSHSTDSCLVLLEQAPGAIEPGTPLVLNCTVEPWLRFSGHVSSVAGNRLQVAVSRVIPPDKRSYPRMYAGISISYSIVSQDDESALSAWTERGLRQGPTYNPDLFMDFSSTGLCFEDLPRCSPGHHLLLELRIPPSPKAWRASARVLRVEPLKPTGPPEPAPHEPGSPTHHIAIEFLHLPPGAAKALANLTLQQQRQILDTSP